ncbi:calponin-like protein [Dinothrombium tinctorium]|uniref:Calponin-like protein n=1 Tax=Dinothrombium tinctorium TaxID=1965070 RepID=A0A3S3PDG6_9ACAR|nr:calponin-like protein [Dinothrombium tinctorium]RWS10206.1 calponin-like protein [Dinothrombium tinctorium]RWS10559.1 calponin-like protein [Dinothrombium tinctorium]
MADYRATKSGLAAEAQEKVNSKYDAALASEILNWIKTLTGDDINTSGDRDNFYETLKSGAILCRLINAIKPDSIPTNKINKGNMAFKCMENINHFLTHAKALGVPDIELFQAVDLWEAQNLTSVVFCLQALGRKAHKHGVGFGPKEAEKNVRNFSEEQRLAGNAVIGAQMGAFKGATQSGQNFGNTRHM